MNIKDIVKDQKAHFVFYRDRPLFFMKPTTGFSFLSQSTMQGQQRSIEGRRRYS